MLSQEQLRSIPQKWASAWGDKDASVWPSLYSSTATYTDHAFFIRRTGTAMLNRHFSIWKTAHPDFTMEVERVVSSSQENGKFLCSIRTINTGTFLHDLPSKKASGKPFLFSGVVDFVVDGESGLIEKVDEWYSWAFERSTSVEGYHTLDSNESKI